MKVIAVNGSPRKDWNTAILLKNALEGAASQGAETEIIHLYDLSFKGCISCFSCKLKGGKSCGKCVLNDDLKPLLSKIEESDAVILGSPIYFGGVTGVMRSFLERLMFQYLVYDANYSSLSKKKIKGGFIYTMNVDEKRAKEIRYEDDLKRIETAFARSFGPTMSLMVTDTYQFDDYTKYETSAFNAEEKAKRRKEVFPLDCRKAFEMGAFLAEKDTTTK
ncbi:MAG TPA: flavodoxin family protein [Clostridia bacterium]